MISGEKKFLSKRIGGKFFFTFLSKRIGRKLVISYVLVMTFLRSLCAQHYHPLTVLCCFGGTDMTMMSSVALEHGQSGLRQSGLR